MQEGIQADNGEHGEDRGRGAHRGRRDRPGRIFHGFGAGTLIRHGGQQLHQLVLQSRVFIAHAVVEHGVKPGVPLAYGAEQRHRGVHRLAQGGNNLDEDRGVSRAVNLRGFHQAVGDTVVHVRPDHQHIVAADGAGDHIDPEAVGKTQRFIEELANCPWYDFQRHSELTAAQKEQTEAVRNAQQAYADSRNAIDELTGTIDLYSGQIVDMKLAEVGVGDELVNGLGNVQSSLDEVAGSMQGYGQNIAEGLRNGIDENTQEAEYKSIWQRIADWFTGLWEINSPSRLSYSWGEYISTGLLNGLSESWGSIGAFFSEKTDAIKQTCSDAWENVKSTAAEKWASIKTDLGETWENIKISAGEKFEAVKERLDPLDIVTNVNQFSTSRVVVSEVKFSYKGAFRGSYRGRGVDQLFGKYFHVGELYTGEV